jgi:hypothetical protein
MQENDGGGNGGYRFHFTLLSGPNRFSLVYSVLQCYLDIDAFLSSFF